MLFAKICLLLHPHIMTHEKKDDQIMRTKSHSCVHFIYLNLHSMPPNGFSPPYKELVVGQVEPSGGKSGDSFIFLTSLSFKPANWLFFPWTLECTLGPLCLSTSLVWLISRLLHLCPWTLVNPRIIWQCHKSRSPTAWHHLYKV